MAKTGFRTYMYSQQMDFLPSHFSETSKIKEYLDNNLPKGSQYAFIVHDKDYYLLEHEQAERDYLAQKHDLEAIREPKEEWVEKHLTKREGAQKASHLHISVYLPNTKTLSAMAKCFGDKEQYIQKFDGKNAKQNVFSYLIHRTEGSKHDGKYEYDMSEVTANFDYKSYVDGISVALASASYDKATITQQVLNDKLRMIDFIMDDKLMDFYLKNKTFVTTLIDTAYKRKMNEKKDGNDGVKVIYIQGPAGSGKSTYARKYALKHYRDYCVSSSHNDAVQDYLGQEVMIFDDARPSDFTASDWLKILDPFNNNCSVNSRYYNKYLAVKCIILTTTTPFEEFFIYAKGKGGTDEPVGQFMRRFSNVIYCEREDYADAIYVKSTVHTVEVCDKYEMLVNGSRIQYNYKVGEGRGPYETIIATKHSHEQKIDDSEFTL